METLLEALGEDLYEQTLKKSVVSLGCGKRLREIFQKETVKLAFLGASITRGYITATSPCGAAYPDYTGDVLAREFGTKSVESRNLSVIGTDSFTGMLVTRIFLPDYRPDIIFLEYAINEQTHPIGLEKYESMLRMLLSLEWKPVIIPVVMFNRDGYSCHEFMLHFAKHYHTPMISLKDSIYPLIASGWLDMNTYTEDEGHLHKDGHELVAECIRRAIVCSIAENEPYLPLAEKVTAARFEGFRLLDLKAVTAPYTEECVCPDAMFGTCLKKLKNGKPLVLETECEFSQMLVMYIKNARQEFAAVNIMSDGERIGGFTSRGLFGWNNAWVELVISEEEKKIRKITFETENGDENKNLYLVAVAVC